MLYKNISEIIFKHLDLREKVAYKRKKISKDCYFFQILSDFFKSKKQVG